MVPLSSCDEAATYLIKALGGEDVARQVVGGIKWWQVRGVNGLVVSFHVIGLFALSVVVSMRSG